MSVQHKSMHSTACAKVCVSSVPVLTRMLYLACNSEKMRIYIYIYIDDARVQCAKMKAYKCVSSFVNEYLFIYKCGYVYE